MTLIWLLAAGVVLIVLAHIVSLVKLTMLRRSGVYPLTGQATMADVVRLKAAGSEVLATRCYREIHRCGLRQAKEAVASLSIGI
jgi:hypothetical protein